MTTEKNKNWNQQTVDVVDAVNAVNAANAVKIL